MFWCAYVFTPQVLLRLFLACAHARAFLWAATLFPFVSFSGMLVLNLSVFYFESEPIFVPFTHALFAFLYQRLSFFFQVALFRSLTRPLSLPLVPCLFVTYTSIMTVSMCDISKYHDGIHTEGACTTQVRQYTLLSLCPYCACFAKNVMRMCQYFPRMRYGEATH